MAILDVSRLYSDGEVLTEAQLDQIRTDIETYFNLTKIDGENIQNAGMTASALLVPGSISSDKFADLSVLAGKFVDLSVTTPKVADSSVTSEKVLAEAATAAKRVPSFLATEEGAVRLFHTYNSLLDVPRGWMICNGDVVNETNYNAIHGSGTYAEDGISASNLLSVNLPNMTDKLAVGSATTTQDGSVAITTVGNTDSQVDLQHTHTVTHTHPTQNTVLVDTAVTSGLPINNVVPATSDSAAADLSAELSTTQSILPESIRTIFIVRVI